MKRKNWANDRKVARPKQKYVERDNLGIKSTQSRSLPRSGNLGQNGTCVKQDEQQLLEQNALTKLIADADFSADANDNTHIPLNNHMLTFKYF